MLEEELSEYQAKLYTAASRTDEIVMQRPRISPHQDFYLEPLYSWDAHAPVYCLPSPIPYLQALPLETRELLQELAASGEISGYSA